MSLTNFLQQMRFFQQSIVVCIGRPSSSASVADINIPNDLRIVAC